VVLVVLASTFDVAAVGSDRVSGVVIRACGGLLAGIGFFVAGGVGIVLVGFLGVLVVGVVVFKQALAGGALARKRLLIVFGVGKERVLFATVAVRHRGSVVHTEGARLGLVDPGVALAVIHRRAEGF